ncbi:unnamed protein product, partial [Mesorhabditis spiculigera]
MFQEARVSTQRIQAFLALEDFHPVEQKPEILEKSEIAMEPIGANAERKPLIRNGQSELTEQWCELQPHNPKTLVELSNYSSSWARPNADIYLLDDPLSAVDAAVGRFIFDKCICEYLRDRVVILVTHQLQFIGRANEILLMRDGEVVLQGTLKQLKESNSKLVHQLIQVLNRFSKDMHTMDESLAFVFFEFVLGMLGVLGTVGVIFLANPRMNMNSAAFSLSLTTSRWFAVQIDWIVAGFVSFVAFACAFASGDFLPGEVALMLVYAVQLTGFFSWIMRQSAEMQNGMVSVERILNMCALPSEHLDKGHMQTPSGWPSKGEIRFDNFSLRYDDSLALREITANIDGNQKVGVVGRTGAGKSSLLKALFRMNKVSTGRIFIDGVDINCLQLRELRSHLAIIPQEAVSELSGTLLAEVQEGGANFSVGQRQLFCLARALLRNSKILVIDEATANVDPHTDELIQKTIRRQFANSTVLTIAHRLHTIMDSDRVMVLKDGRLIEFAHPYELLKKPHSQLSALVKETGRDTAAQLLEVARRSHANANQADGAVPQAETVPRE